MNVISIFIANIILVTSMLYIFKSLLNKKINFKHFKTYFIFVFTVLFSILNFYYINNFIKVVLIVIMFSLIIEVLFKEELKKAITTTLFYELLIVISEGVFAILATIIFNLDVEKFVATNFGIIITNLSISMLSILFIKISYFKKLYNFMNSIVDKLKHKHLIIISLVLVIIMNILEALLYYDINYRVLLIFNTFLILFCFGLVLHAFRAENNYVKVSDKYKTTLNSLKEYEYILDRYKILGHENKNQLLTIRNIISKDNQKAISYIDKIIDNNIKDDEKAMFKVSKIPAGGLRGLMYSKILIMDEMNIKYNLEISKEVKTIDIIKMDDGLILDICRVLGVYLDNAIDAVKEMKNKEIAIQLYINDNQFIISVSNNYENLIEIEKIEQIGYSLKGKNRGYGLSLAKEIVDKNPRLTNEKKISKYIFTQILKIKI